MRRIFICAISLILAISFSACAAGNDTDNKESQTSQQEQFFRNEDNDIAPDNENCIVWAVPDIVRIPDENLADFNAMLREKGCNFSLELLQLPFDDYDNSLDKAQTDIAFAGFNQEVSTQNIAYNRIKSGYFCCLDNFLKRGDLYSTISPKLWESVKYDGKIYVVPCGAASDQGLSVVFNLDKISVETAKAFEGKASDIRTLEAENKTDWSIYITKDLGTVKNENIYAHTSKAILSERYSASTGIAASSDKKDAAFELLTLLHTDSDLANCLIYGKNVKN